MLALLGGCGQRKSQNRRHSYLSRAPSYCRLTHEPPHTIHLYPHLTMSDDFDSKLVIGYKRSVAKVAKKDSDINGMQPLYPTLFVWPLVGSCKGIVHTRSIILITYPIFLKARRVGAVVATDKKIASGQNKSHQGWFAFPSSGVSPWFILS